MSPVTLLLAGGGTGGHVYPMIAVADALRAVARDVRLVFVGTRRGIETRVVPERGYELELVDVLPLRGGGLGGAWRGALRAGAALPESSAILRRFEPRAVFSIGGYAAGPLTLAARLRGVPVALMEPNARIGLANRLIAPLVQRAYTAFPDPEPYFRSRTVLRAGVPIRAGFEPRPCQYDAPRLRLLVLGGSQGAAFLNEQLPLALTLVRTPLEVVHQAGPGRQIEVRERYGARPDITVVPFIDDMPAALAAAHLVVGRAGASAVAELCAVGRPGLLVPYPYAAADHQLHNARSVERAGGASCLVQAEATPGRIASEIDRLASTRGLLARMADCARSLGHPEAAATIARDLLQLGRLAAADADLAQPSSPTDDGVRWRLGEVG
jgi:UDP-N-acetylglucosamine--N-acetylmuramyl-(pentapeptide) pyrophosphoryl-undecaprenol N-acetylglucosamine transferase